ncbi:hypothetical protein [Vallicoccus soli]|uniref:EfeO-type cupredoxin-like domain-containing protein n=1 Tax=Vallicoccus soli TaxID=2339232 RepID=A0A3A3YV43_9ACTN|nr:hypothetical protein [Vallicoccus soli]RJK95421.1 hypothetical protein D5H78_12255 [Vallicoccus soli]
MTPLRRQTAAAALLAALALAGCASADEERPTAPAATASAAPSPAGAAPGATPGVSPEVTPTAPGVVGTPGTVAPQAREIEVSVVEGEVRPATGTYDVEQGEQLRITVTSDEPDELHVHGFGDPSLELEPGVPGTLELTADETGQFEVETHESGLLLFTLAVR